MSKIVLISCVSKKKKQPSAAQKLYTSPLFKMNLAFARSLNPTQIFILSAKHGLVKLEQIISPYDQSLNTMSAAENKAWADKVKKQMEKELDFKKDEVIFLAGEKYRRNLLPLFSNAQVPLKGLTIGKQLQYLKKSLAKES